MESSLVRVDSTQNTAFLTKHIRLLIYGFLTTKEILGTISRLGKTERLNLVGSNLASAEREVELTNFDNSKHGFLLEIVNIASFSLMIKDEQRGSELIDHLLQLPDNLRQGRIKLNFTMSPTMSEQAATIFLYEFFTMLGSSDITFDTLQISNIPQRELIIDLYQVFMRTRTLALNGRDAVLSFPHVK